MKADPSAARAARSVAAPHPARAIDPKDRPSTGAAKTNAVRVGMTKGAGGVSVTSGERAKVAAGRGGDSSPDRGAATVPGAASASGR